ncbi:MAG TPA: LamG-like jellyroll fold domain-containing protein [Ignavibacteriaceae bacterium]|nr:LamG-like jellyroll fold domain-containing protein [Ignavibacteriaceae bacterium]
MKNSTFFLVCIIFMLAPLVLGQLPDPVGHWTFDEGSGETTADLSGNGNDGQIWSDGVFWSNDTPTGTGYSLEFSGKTGGVYIGDPDTLKIVGDITLAAWIKTDSATENWQNIVVKGHGAGENVLRVDGNGHPTQIWCGSYDNTDHMVKSWDLTDELNRWLHVVGTYSTADGLWTLYLDGVWNSQTEDATGAVTVNRGWAIGARAPDTSAVMFPTERHFEGFIDDVRIYNVALTEAQVAELYTQTSTAVEDKSDLLPSNFNLGQNYPNPFNPQTRINYQVPHTADINISVYNSIGQLVTVLVDEMKSPGNYSVSWNAKDQSSGIYLVRMVSDNYSVTRKLTLLK